MLVELQKRKCLWCGHEFTHAVGGIVLILHPLCPVCHSPFTRRIRRII